MKYFVIGDEDTVLGFSLVGVFGMQATNAQQAKRAWDKAVEDSQNGIIIITDEVANMIRPIVDRFLFSESFPLVVEIPSPPVQRREVPICVPSQSSDWGGIIVG